MVNTEEFTNRLHEIMDFHELSAASFADRIDVGRSSISHLLSGRNKPSLDFVMKIVNAFPEVELYWLLNGKGSFPKKEKEISSASPSRIANSSNPRLDLFSEQKKELASSNTQERKLIDKIVIFYSDGSFEAFQN